MTEATEEAVTPDPSLATDLIQAFPSYDWQLVFLPFFGGVGLCMLIFPRREFCGMGLTVLFVTALALYGFALGLDFIEDMEKEHPLNIHESIRTACDTRMYTVRHFSKSLDEFSEMLATTILWVVLLLHLAQVAPKIHLEFHPLRRQFLRNKPASQIGDIIDANRFVVWEIVLLTEILPLGTDDLCLIRCQFPPGGELICQGNSLQEFLIERSIDGHIAS